MGKHIYYIGFLLFLWMVPERTMAQDTKILKLNHKIEKKLVIWKGEHLDLSPYSQVKVDSVSINPESRQIKLFFAPELSYLPFREDKVTELYQSISNQLGKKYKGYQLLILTNKHEIRDLIPNWARTQPFHDAKRDPVQTYQNRIPLVRRLDSEIPEKGLYNNNLVIWGSHGFFYEPTLDRWEFQRAKLFGTVEDVLPTSYILQYLLPMLENAGATVIMPRERDIQTHEVVVDNDFPDQGHFIFPSKLMFQMVEDGFLFQDTIFPGDRPFESGTSARITPRIFAGQQIQFIPEIPEKGTYAVYVTYLRNDSNSSGVEYIVHHLGGDTHFLVNQKIGGNSWVFLGTYEFDSGTNPQKGGVSLHIHGNENGYISADAVRFGGGMGNVARRTVDHSGDQTWKLSGVPRYVEGARYYLQYDGAPDSLTYNLSKGKNDYNDDLQSRGEWINYLVGKSKPQFRSSFNKGLDIPVDLSLAWHTDAGYAARDSVVGTLVLYSSEKNNGIFPDGQSKMTSRDLADLVQTQIVEDIRKEFKSDWTRREMWDKGFSEAYRQIVPAMLLELLSHQNMNDMRYSQDPRFRFTVSRAIYKGMLKYLAYQQQRPFVVQPLPVDHFGIAMAGGKNVRLSWHPVQDTLESTASAHKYKIYKRTGSDGFDNGTLVNDTSCLITLDQYDQIYSFKITALNEGGESFPSEVLSVGIKNEKAPIALIVNKFNRLCAPAFMDQGNMAGLASWSDQGVPYQAELGFIGDQYDFDKKSEWKDDDNPGLGASYQNLAGRVIPGNTFDYAYVHGESVLANGYSFVSVNSEVFEDRGFDVKSFQFVDVILGEEKSTPGFKDHLSVDFRIYTPGFMNKIRELTSMNKGIFLSGAYVASDLMNEKDSTAIQFTRDIFHFEWRTHHACSTGNFYTTDKAYPGFHLKGQFNTGYNQYIYSVESPDALVPDGGNATTLIRYAENNTSAAVGFQGKWKTVVCGFPFETILSSATRKELMGQILNFVK